MLSYISPFVFFGMFSWDQEVGLTALLLSIQEHSIKRKRLINSDLLIEINAAFYGRYLF